MGLFRRKKAATIEPRAEQIGVGFTGMNDPALLEYIRGGDYSRRLTGLRNMAALRCLSLICESIGMLPLNLIENNAKRSLAVAHPAYRLLKHKPNDYQTPYEFKSQMQLSVLRTGNAYARVVWSRGRPLMLLPLDAERVTATLNTRYQMEYTVQLDKGNPLILSSRDVFHLRDLSADGVMGLSRMKLATGALKLAQDAQTAAERIFTTGNMAGGSVEVPKALSDIAYTRMRDSLDNDFSGAENIQRWMLLEEGAKANKFNITAADAQHIENRNAQIEEVARAFGVPRPLLMMHDTSWGSGIEQLSILFVQYGLQHWFTAWEQAIMRVLLSEQEMAQLTVKFNEHALLRGTLKDQADYLAKALGAGGHAPWMTQNEVRDTQDMPEFDDASANQLRQPFEKQDDPHDPSNDAND